MELMGSRKKVINYQSVRPWQPRWDVIEPHVPFAEAGEIAADLGAAEGAFSYELACKGYRVNSWEKVRKNQYPSERVNWITKPFSPESTYLPPMKVALLLSVIHHFPDPMQVLDAFVEKADLVFVELAAEGPRAAELRERLDAEGEVLGWFPRGKRKDILRPIYKVATR